LDAREGSFDRRAVLACVVLYSLTAVLYRQPGWMAPGALILALLSDPLPSAGLSHSQPQAAGSKLPPADPQRTHAAGPRRPSHRSLGVLERMKS